MKKSILVTAVAGTGKTTVCAALAKLGYESYDLESIKGLFSLVDPTSNEVLENMELGDISEQTEADWVCNPAKLHMLFAGQKNEIAFYCGGTSRTEELMSYFSTTIVLQVSDATTLRRLSSRKVGEFGAKKEVREWVLSWKHQIETDWTAAGGIAISAEESPDVVAKNIIKLLGDKAR